MLSLDYYYYYYYYYLAHRSNSVRLTAELPTCLINLKQYKSEHSVSYLTVQVSPINRMNLVVLTWKLLPLFICSQRSTGILVFSSINRMKLLDPTSCVHDLIQDAKRHNPQTACVRHEVNQRQRQILTRTCRRDVLTDS